MKDNQQLNIIGYRDRLVPNVLYQQPGDQPRGLAMLLPGFGYHNDMPLMFYSHQAAFNAGLDVLRVNYAYNQEPEWAQMTDEEQAQWLYADTNAALEAALSHRDYTQIFLIGKSLGTMAMAHLLEQYKRLPETGWIWLTPVLKDPALRRNILTYHPRSLVVIGTADPYYDFALLGELFHATEDRVEIFEGADHGLIIQGDLSGSIRALGRAIEAEETFLKFGTLTNGF